VGVGAVEWHAYRRQ
jgi:hypothetical protein